MASARVYNSCARIYAPIFMKFFLVVSQCLINLSFKFRKDPSFRWGDISLFVTVFDLELKILSSLTPKKNAILNMKLRFFLDTICPSLLHRRTETILGKSPAIFNWHQPPRADDPYGYCDLPIICKNKMPMTPLFHCRILLFYTNIGDL